MIHLTAGNAVTPEEEEVMAQWKKVMVRKVHANDVYRSKDGKWRTYIGTGRKDRRRIQESTEKALYERLYRYYYEDGQEMTLKQAFERFLDNKAKTSTACADTLRKDRQNARFWAEIEGKRLQDITADDIREQIKKHAPYTVSGLKKKLIIIRSTFRWAAKRRWIHDNPAEEVTPKDFYALCAVKEEEDRTYSPKETEDIWAEFRWITQNHKKNINAYTALIAIETGMRVGEIVALHWEDIQGGFIHVHRQQRRTNDVGKPTKYEEAPFTKNERGIPRGGRFVPISPALSEVLEELREKTGGVYVLSYKGEWLKKENCNKFISRQLLKHGHKITGIHVFRRTLNSNVLYEAGLTGPERAAFLGHKPETNLRFYSYTRHDQATAIAEKMAKNAPKRGGKMS